LSRIRHASRFHGKMGPMRRVLTAFAALALLTLAGAAGYMLVEGWSFQDSL